MKILTILIFAFLFSCTQNDVKNHTSNNLKFDKGKNYTFNEYVSIINSLNKNKSFPNINDIPN